MSALPDQCPRCGGSDWHKEGQYNRCRICQNKRQRARRKRNPQVVLHDGAKRRARLAGLPFDLTLDDVRELLADWTCSYCQTEVGSFTGGIRPNSATLDRIIPTEGYTRANTALACHKCNAAKGDHTPTSLRDWADRIDEVLNRQNPKRETNDSGKG